MSFAKSNNLSLLLKGEKDYITNGDYFKINTTGHPRMAVGGRAICCLASVVV